MLTNRKKEIKIRLPQENPGTIPVYVKRAKQYLWSSATAHMLGRDDNLVTVKPLLKLVDD
jgi:hypothetical protein